MYKTFIFVLFVLLIGVLFNMTIYKPISMIEPKYIPLRLKIGSLVFTGVVNKWIPRKLIRKIQSMKVPQSRDDVIVSFENMEYVSNITGEIVRITLNVYTPVEKEMNGVIVFYHGGGFLIGHPHSLDPFLYELSKETGMIVVSPDYRMMTEYVLDDIFEDGIEVVRYVKKKYGETNLVVSGESAGGKLSLLVAYFMRNNNYPKDLYMKELVHFIPIYSSFCKGPDCRVNSKYKYACFTSKKNIDVLYGYKERQLRKFQSLSVEKNIGNFNNLPSMFIVGAEYDSFIEEEEEYYRKGVENGQDFDFFKFLGEIHGFCNVGANVKKGAYKIAADKITMNIKKRFELI